MEDILDKVKVCFTEFCRRSRLFYDRDSIVCMPYEKKVLTVFLFVTLGLLVIFLHKVSYCLSNQGLRSAKHRRRGK